MPGEVVRWALLSAHYRQPLDWNQSLLDQSRKNLDRLYGALGRAKAVDVEAAEPPAEFLTAIQDDLNTPGAIASLFALSSEIERGMTAGDLTAVSSAKSALLATIARTVLEAALESVQCAQTSSVVSDLFINI